MATSTPSQEKAVIPRKHPLAECERCPLYNKPVAPTTGPPGARIAVVSRSPGYNEAMQGKPFAGKSGDLLTHLLKMYDTRREDVLLTNVVLCHTDKPPKEAIDACKLRLETEINASQTIIACGAEATKALLGGNTSVHSGRGRTLSRRNFSNNAQRVVVTFNPAAALRDDQIYPDLVRDFKRGLVPRPEPRYPLVRWTEDVDEAREWLLRVTGECAIDIEATGLAAGARIYCVGFATTGDEAFVLGKSVVQDKSFFLNELRQILENRRIKYIWHNGKYDVKQLRWRDAWAVVDEDTMLLSYALDERGGGGGDYAEQFVGRVHSLDYLLSEEFGWEDYESRDVRRFKKAGFIDEDKLPELYKYNGYDTAGTFRLYNTLVRRAEEDHVLGFYRSHLLPACEAAIRLEINGFTYDIRRAYNLLDNDVRPALGRQRTELRRLAGDAGYNPNSAPQTANLVYDNWQVEHGIVRPGMERSVDKSVYTEIAGGRFRHRSEVSRDTIIEWAKIFRDFKRLDKQRSTYIEGMIPRVRNGRIYTEFKQHGTTSSRWSSANPNLQNITRGGHSELPNTRSLFRASPGRIILQADYSQAELRTIAELSGDEELAGIYERGDDLHSLAAENFYGPEFTKEQRSRAKNMNFGICYMQGAATFQEKHDIPEEEAQKYIDWFLGYFTGIRQWWKATEDDLFEHGFIHSPFGNKRRFHLVTRENRNAIIREAVNFKPQCIASGFTISSLCTLIRELNSRRVQPVVSVHDSIVFDCDPNYSDTVKIIAKEVMESRPKDLLGWKIPFEVDIQTGPNWGEVG